MLSRGDLLRWCSAAGDIISRQTNRRLPGQGPYLCAIVAPRSWTAPLGLIAARFAGLAFMLLDPAQPAARLGSILAMARPALLLGQTKDRTRLNELIGLSGLQPAAACVPIAPPDSRLETLLAFPLTRPRRLPPGTGHLVFTSGSTGQPKGVILRDAPLLHTVAAQRALLGTDGRGVDAEAPSVWALDPGFDASLSDIFCAIGGSAPLLVFRDAQTRWRSLAASIGRHGAARADLAPALLRIVPPEALGLRAVVFGGERCDPATAERWGRATLALQAYGPTEAAVCATMARAGPGWVPGQLGRPLPHQVVLLRTPEVTFRVVPRTPEAGPDAADFNATVLVPDPAGAVDGEIWLAGDAVATGYLDAPDAERDRFGVENGMRVHRTGDIARWEKGQLVWLGRMDRQLKIHGRLICPEEVEAAAEAIWGAACACFPSRTGLVLALGPDGTGHPEAVLAGVSRRLGRPMAPRRAVVLRTWFFLPNGKTDLAAVAAAATRSAP